MTVVPTRIGVIGLGKMGLPMAGHLMAAGYEVVGYEPDPGRREAAAAAGVSAAGSPAEVAAATEGSLVVVGFDDEVNAVCLGDNGVLAGAVAGHLVMVCSTVRPDTVTAIDRELRAKGIATADATLCRAEHAAVDGTLLVLLGGDVAELQPWDAPLRTFATDIVHLGPVGSGQVGKMINNVLLWISVIGNQETLRLARRLGMDQERLREALLLSSGSNWALETWMKARPMPWAEKDLGICLDVAAEEGYSMPLTAAARELMKGVKQRKAQDVPGGATASMFDFVEHLR